MTTQLQPKKLPISGRVVTIPRVAVSTITLDLARLHPKPEPPIQEVKLAGQVVVERNYAHPMYDRMIADWNQQIELAATEAVLRKIASVNPVPDGDMEAVQAARETYGALLDGLNDRMVWLRYVAIESDDDFKALMVAARAGGDPDPARIEAAAGTFRG